MPGVVLGRLVRTIGLSGELGLHETPDFWPGALDSRQLFLVRDGERRQVSVRGARRRGARMTAVLLDGVGDIAAAEAAVGAELVLELDGLDVPLPLEPRPFQVRGLAVLLPDGRVLGRVEDRLELPAQAVYVVRDASREYLIPDVPAFVKQLDLKARVLRIEPIPGLLDA